MSGLNDSSNKTRVVHMVLSIVIAWHEVDESPPKPTFSFRKKKIYIYIYIYLATKRKKVYKTGILRTSKPSPKINPKPFMILCSNSSLPSRYYDVLSRTIYVQKAWPRPKSIPNAHSRIIVSQNPSKASEDSKSKPSGERQIPYKKPFKPFHFCLFHRSLTLNSLSLSKTLPKP